jgi:hypothetical protein
MCPWNALRTRWRRALHVAVLVLLGIIVHATNAGAVSITSMHFYNNSGAVCDMFTSLNGPGVSVGKLDLGNCGASVGGTEIDPYQYPLPGTILDVHSYFVGTLYGTIDGKTLTCDPLCDGPSAGMESYVDIYVPIPDVVPLGFVRLQGVAVSHTVLYFFDGTFTGEQPQNINFIGTGPGTVTIFSQLPAPNEPNDNIIYEIHESSAVLTAVPEPSTLLLLVSGLTGLVAWRWKHAA